MDDKQSYIDNLKSLNLRPNRIKIKEHEPVLLNEQESKGNMDLHEKIIQWFIKNPKPADDKVHAFSEKMGINPHKFEGHIYMILSDLIHEGRSKKFTGKYDPKELAMGTEVEKEHMPYQSIAEKIAKDHLAEFPDYYTRLKKMEAAGGAKKSVSEIFIQSSEIEALAKGDKRDMQILRLGIIAEMDASNLYEKLALLAKNPDVATLMNDVSEEEKVHAGEFQFLLEDIDPEWKDAEEEGEGEVKDLL